MTTSGNPVGHEVRRTLFQTALVDDAEPVAGLITQQNVLCTGKAGNKAAFLRHMGNALSKCIACARQFGFVSFIKRAPSVGCLLPPRILTSVVLPAPFSPISRAPHER